jgi:hypothetical protein
VRYRPAIPHTVVLLVTKDAAEHPARGNIALRMHMLEIDYT